MRDQSAGRPLTEKAALAAAQRGGEEGEGEEGGEGEEREEGGNEGEAEAGPRELDADPSKSPS